ncbi:hypothetical protein IZT72_07675 [Pseudomonas brenneri]|uniref:hypothetical protein n=1 Tax=Pseudomonas brenneri TaxID=129817 RepID=UPI0018A2AEA6|nr:hypothetical protein [Pseudomonas brenneri]MBF8004476.1 hypothetical protein [Pseudomonas brenneri]
MNSAQRVLLEKTFGRLGYLLITLAIVILLYGLDDSGSRFVNYLFEGEDLAPAFWLSLIAGVGLVWSRAFLRAGKQ